MEKRIRSSRGCGECVFFFLDEEDIVNKWRCVCGVLLFKKKSFGTITIKIDYFNN